MGQPFRSIVVGVSDAATSHIAARTAVDLAQATGATVHFVTAVVSGQLNVIQVGSDRFVTDNVESARKGLQRFVDSLGVWARGMTRPCAARGRFVVGHTVAVSSCIAPQ